MGYAIGVGVAPIILASVAGVFGCRTIHRMPRGFAVLALVIAGFLAGCGGGTPSGAGTTATTKSAPDVPELAGSDPTLAATVDCGDEGVANVEISYGEIGEQVLVGRNPTTQAVGGQKAFSAHYGLGRGDENVMFVITTSPTRGSCRTTVTDYDSGDVIVDKETAGRATLRVLVTGKD